MGSNILNAGDVNNYYAELDHDVAGPSGSDFTVSPIGHSRSRLVAISFLFTTDANAADRLVRLKVVRGGVDHFLSSAAAVQPANKAYRYFFMVGGCLTDIPNPVCYHAPLPDSFIFIENDTLQSDIENIQILDRVTLTDYFWEIQPAKG